ncbi:hypothetical protein K438DRAFT_1966050 [Mycena galopus ATCC 62051]|nr:hypothetical protein K438DRAFT_1966050 [Mycena galopus ATCC 62051]
MARWRRKVSVYIGGPDDPSSFIRATFPGQTQPHPHNLLVFATPYQRCEVACCWGRTYMIRVRGGGPPQGILGAKEAPPSCTVAGAARSCSAVDALSGLHSRIRWRAPIDGWCAGTNTVEGRARGQTGRTWRALGEIVLAPVLLTSQSAVVAFSGSHISTIAEKNALIILAITHGEATRQRWWRRTRTRVGWRYRIRGTL